MFWAKVYGYDLECAYVFLLHKIFLVGTWWSSIFNAFGGMVNARETK